MMIGDPTTVSTSSDASLKLDHFLLKEYGFKCAQLLKVQHPQRKDLIRAVLVRELAKTYKYPEAAY